MTNEQKQIIAAKVDVLMRASGWLPAPCNRRFKGFAAAFTTRTGVHRALVLIDEADIQHAFAMGAIDELLVFKTRAAIEHMRPRR